MTEKYIDQNETFAQVLDRMAIDGLIAPKGIDAFTKAYRADIVVDKVSNSLTMHNKPLSAAVEAILKKDADFWAPRGGQENVQREVVEEERLGEELKRKALSGNVTEHGRLRNHLGGLAYDEWCASTGAKPGVTILASELNGEKVHQIKKASLTNPWSAAAWNTTKQGQLVRSLGQEKAEQIAAAAGCKLGSTKPNPHFN